MKKVLVLSSSLRKGSNSETLAQEFAKGAAEAGNKVEFESLRGKKIAFCMGCLACQKKGKCVIKDDANAITKKMESADVIVFATPIYYYEMSGQLKTMLDRANSLYSSDYKFREIYLLTSAADTDAKAMNIAKRGIGGWIACFDGVKLKGALCATGAESAGDVKKNSALLKKAFAMGKKI
ncbi:flavodoxin family protein [Fibrobacter sp. UBA3718]|uniref:flavodoxin family protein n=1 Tax=Fibrobacter sp. UBA3718 TaxID=1946531 RepID=UPI0025BDD62D|nr:flavodoxin family protein [Fibrobacter sp. UBA3718]